MTQFFSATTDAIAFLDREYRFTFLNRHAAELLAPSGDILGRNLFEAFPSATHPELYRRTMQDGERSEFEAFYPEPLNLWFHVQSYPARDGIILFFRDITQEREAKQTLREKNEEVQRQLAEIETMYRTAPIGLALSTRRIFATCA